MTTKESIIPGKRKAIYSVLEYMQFFLLISVIGWGWEILVYWCSHGFQDSLLHLILNFRGMLHGPWVPIYGAGACLMVFMKKRFSPLKAGSFFAMNMIACAMLEYVTSLVLEILFHARWWDYTGQFLNLNGRICAMSLIFFSLAGFIVVYIIEPHFHKKIQKIPCKIRLAASLVLTFCFLLDASVSFAYPNIGIGVSII